MDMAQYYSSDFDLHLNDYDDDYLSENIQTLIHSDNMQTLIHSDVDVFLSLDNELKFHETYGLFDGAKIKDPDAIKKDCMWPAQCPSQQDNNANGININLPMSGNSSAASSFSESMSVAVPLAAVMPGSCMPTTIKVEMNVEDDENALTTTTTAGTTTTKRKSKTTAPTVVTASSTKSHRMEQNSCGWPTNVAERQQQNGGSSIFMPINIKNEIDIKYEAEDDYEQKLQQHSILIPNGGGNSKTKITSTSATTARTSCNSNLIGRTFATAQKSMQHIPPGTSLLRRSNQQQQQQTNTNNSSCSYPQQHLRYDKSLKSSTLTASIRPDTPLSLSEDTMSCGGTVFRHNVDLQACVMGSNQMFADQQIDKLSLELQNTNKTKVDSSLLGPQQSMDDIVDIMDYINNEPTSPSSLSSSTSSSSTSSASSTNDATELTSCLHNSGSSGYESDDCYDNSKNNFVPSSLLGDEQYPRHITDHSYTRTDDIGSHLETPSDSDEEYIDVESVCDNKLPTNPTDKDRRALQSKVAHSFSNGRRIYKSAIGMRGSQPSARRGSYEHELPYTPASSSPVKSMANSRFPSPASTPARHYIPLRTVNGHQQATAAANSFYSQDIKYAFGSSSSATTGTAATPASTPTTSSTATAAGLTSSSAFCKSRKRIVMQPSSTVRHLPPAKKYRGKKGSKPLHHGVISVNASSSPSSATATATASAMQSPLSSSSTSSSATTTTTAVAAAASMSSTSAAAAAAINNATKLMLSINEAETMEKRNLHNDMERQRRIGLKNLFEALKKEIPSIKDKDRAPKVNILREAAKLCEQLTRDDRELSEQKSQLLEQMKRRKELLARLNAMQ